MFSASSPIFSVNTTAHKPHEYLPCSFILTIILANLVRIFVFLLLHLVIIKLQKTHKYICIKADLNTTLIIMDKRTHTGVQPYGYIKLKLFLVLSVFRKRLKMACYR